LKHKPFSALRGVVVPHAPERPASPQPSPRLAAPPPVGRLFVREELDAVENGVLTRVIGLPRDRLDALGRRLREALGRPVQIEGRDLLAMTEEGERVAAWIRGAVGGQIVLVRRPAAPEPSRGGAPGGTERARIRRGLRVAIVQKADQPSGVLTEGIVRDILTSSPVHPRGIKVRLESGEVGRVQRIFPG
jgi:uncharacterized repeat protein (TIGR03833 family)